MIKLVNIIECFGLKGSDFNVSDYRAFQLSCLKKGISKDIMSERTFKRYKARFGYSTKYHKRADKDIKRLINRNNYDALDGLKVKDIGILMIAHINNKKCVGFDLIVKHINKNTDYHNIENNNNAELLSKCLRANYKSVSDNHGFYKSFFKNNRNHVFCKNKNASISPERRVRYLKYLLGKTSWNMFKAKIQKLNNEGKNIKIWQSIN